MNKYRVLRNLGNILKLMPKQFKELLYEINTSTNLKIQVAIRYAILSSLVNEIGNNVYVGKNVSLKNMEKVCIGNNVSIHDLSYIDGFGGLEIGNNVSIAHSSTIITANHTWNNTNIPIKYNKVIKGKVEISDDVWIGCGVRILSNVKIEKRTVVAAGAVVNSDLETGWLGAGVPMRKIKKIGD